MSSVVARTLPEARPPVAVPALLLLLFLFGLWWVGFSPLRLARGAGEFLRIVGLMLPPTPGTTARLLIYVGAMGQSLGIAFVGTIAAAIVALPLSVLAASNVMPVAPLRVALRRLFDVLRGIDRFVWALIFVGVVGLGPFAGVLALTLSNIGGLGKLFAEAIEGADPRAAEGITAAGGGRLAVVRYAILPQAVPLLVSQTLYFFESDTRSATVIGIVGAGGIGLNLYEAITTLEWQHVACIILLILVVVAAIDAASARIRAAVIGPA
jgi:phosphonate transport system permease protein